MNRYSALLAVLTIAAGALVGFLLWELPGRYPILDKETVFQIGKGVFEFFNESEFAIDLARVIVMILFSLPWILVFGIVTGIALHWVRYKKTFFCALPVWWLTGYILVSNAAERWSGDGPNPYAILRGYAHTEFLYRTAGVFSLYLLVVTIAYLLSRTLGLGQEREPA